MCEKNDTNSKVSDYFQIIAICRDLFENYFIYQQLTNLREVLGSKSRVIETLRRDSFYVFVLFWTGIFGSDAETLHWKRILGMDFKEKFLAETKLTEAEWGVIWKNTKFWRNNIIAHLDLKGGEGVYPKNEGLDLHLKLTTIAYNYAHSKIEELSGFNRKASLLKESIENSNDALRFFRVSAEKLRQCLAALENK